MIINNYNGSLAENTENNMESVKSPMVNIRDFDFNLVAGETHLVIPYYVSDFDQTEYRDEEVGPTFTTSFALDEDTVPAAQQLQGPWKQTTYAGEQVIDLGVFNEVGIHTLNVRTIQSNGVASATKPLKFIVRPAGAKTVLDLSSLSGFSGEFKDYRRYNMFFRHVYWDGDGKIGPLLYKYNCNYTVTKTVSNNNVTDIQIVVTGPAEGHSLVGYEIDDDGVINPAKDNLKCIFGLTGGVAGNATKTYHVATQCVVNGETVELKDYLGVPMDEIPAEVVSTAAMNKVALTRLFEAAKAWRFQQVYEDLLDGITNPTDAQKETAALEASDAVKYEFIFKMPKMDIVCDYHYALPLSFYYGSRFGGIDFSAEILNQFLTEHTEEDIPTTGVTQYYSMARKGLYHNYKYFYGRDDIQVPDGITVDMNRSTLSMLQIKGVDGGRLLHLLNNINTHVINGNFVGNYKGVEFTHTDDMETLHMLSIHASLFSSFMGLDISGSVGYELHVGTEAGSDIGINDSVLIPFTDRGYIDYSGTAHSDSGSGLGWYNTGLTNDSCKVLNFGWTVCGREIRVQKYQVESNYHTDSCREMYIHWYDMSNNFIKTTKVLQRWPVLIPYGAWRMRITMYGTVSNSTNDKLNTSPTVGKFGRDFCNLSWCSGVKDIVIHDTRTCALDNGGVQTYVKNLTYRNVAAERHGGNLHYGGSRNFADYLAKYEHNFEKISEDEDYRLDFANYPGDYYHFTKMLVDYEDDRYNLYNAVLEGLEMTYGDTRALNIVGGYDFHIKNCRNVHISLHEEVMDGLVEDSSISILYTHGNKQKGSGLHYILRNCILTSLDNGDNHNGEAGGRLFVKNSSLMTPVKGNQELVIKSDTIKM